MEKEASAFLEHSFLAHYQGGGTYGTESPDPTSKPLLGFSMGADRPWTTYITLLNFGFLSYKVEIIALI